MNVADNCYRAALRLHEYLLRTHWKKGLVGPDPGVRFNYRIGRFAKSLLRCMHWHDDLYYLQAQGYWVLGNWGLFDRTAAERFYDIAMHCSADIVSRQRDDGAWDYPNPEWKGRLATTEGNWASLGLLETYRRTGDDAWLHSALRWHRFLTDYIGFQKSGDEVAVNYFAHRGRARVPNNSSMTLRLLAEMAAATGENRFLEPCPGLMTFLTRVQLPSGELPYQVASSQGGRTRSHFQCY